MDSEKNFVQLRYMNFFYQVLHHYHLVIRRLKLVWHDAIVVRTVTVNKLAFGHVSRLLGEPVLAPKARCRETVLGTGIYRD